MIEDKDAFCASMLLQEFDNLRVEACPYSLIIIPDVMFGLKVMNREPILVDGEVILARPSVMDFDFYGFVAAELGSRALSTAP